MSDGCLFCGGSEASPLTNEHIIPQWLLDSLGLPADDQLFQGIASSETHALVEPPRIHSSFAFVQGRVCDGCNSGWLSRLEDAARPTLIPLMNQSRSLHSLSADEATIVSKWAGKTAYLHTWAGPLNEPIQLPHLHSLYGDGGVLPSGVGVFGMQGDYSQPSTYIQTGHWPQFSSEEAPQSVETPTAAYKIGVQFRRLCLLVAFWPNASSILTRVKNMHIRLTPAAADEEYEVQIPALSGAIEPVKTFAEWLAVWHV